MIIPERRFGYQLVFEKEANDKLMINNGRRYFNKKGCCSQSTRLSAICAVIGLFTLFLGIRSW